MPPASAESYEKALQQKPLRRTRDAASRGNGKILTMQGTREVRTNLQEGICEAGSAIDHFFDALFRRRPQELSPYRAGANHPFNGRFCRNGSKVRKVAAFFRPGCRKPWHTQKGDCALLWRQSPLVFMENYFAVRSGLKYLSFIVRGSSTYSPLFRSLARRPSSNCQSLSSRISPR